MLNITDAQKGLLLEHLPNAQDCIYENDIDAVLDILDAKITEIGFDANYDLNDVGLKLQKLYDQLCNQNC